MLLDFTSISGLIAGALSFTAYLLYIFTTLWGKTRPNRATWWILTAVGCIILASYYSAGARDTIWVPVSYILGPLIVALLSLRYGDGGWTRFDRFCLYGAGVSIILWWFFSSPVLALLTNILIDFLGLLPTVRKAYLKPEGEDRIAWALEFSANTINLFAVGEWIFAIAVYPVYLVLMNGLITALLFRQKKK